MSLYRQVFHNPTYRSQMSIKHHDDDESTKRSTMNHYETADPTPVYESIDEELYEKVHDEAAKEDEATGIGTKPAVQPLKKSRTNPVYDVGNNDDSRNPVVNLSLTSPKKTANSWESFALVYEENDLDDSLNAKMLSTFQASNERGNQYENVGVVNPIALNADNTQVGEGDSKPPTEGKNQLYPLAHQASLEVKSDGEISPPMSPPPVHYNDELYFMGQQRPGSSNDAQSSC